MSHVPHELSEVFAADADALHALKTGNAHFAAQADRYHALNREVHRIDSGIDPASDERAETLKRERLVLLDEISAMIAQQKG